MVLRPRRLELIAIAVVLMITAIAACSGPPTSPNPTGAPKSPVEASWSQVDLPEDVRPTRLHTDQQRLAIGGRRGDGPWIGVLADDQLRPVRMQPNSPYAHTAEIVSLGISGDRLVALGNVHGGAHGNSRWTTWVGDPDEVVDLPQSLEVFGGINGGDLIDIMIDSDGVMIAGSRRFTVGLDPAVWLPDGRTWALQPSPGTALDSTDELLLSARRATADQHKMIMVGSATALGDGVRQRATAWIQDREWRRADLPEPGRRSEATSVTCTPDDPAMDCLISGSVDGRLAGWRLTDDGTTRVSGLPEAAAAPNTPTPRSIVSAEVRAIAYDTGDGTGLVTIGPGNARPQSATAPPGRLIDAAAVGSTCYLITERDDGQRSLWRADLGHR